MGSDNLATVCRLNELRQQNLQPVVWVRNTLPSPESWPGCDKDQDQYSAALKDGTHTTFFPPST